MSFFMSPGVYSREKDLSEIVPGIATTISALVGYSEKGESDDLFLATDSRQFIEEFGEPKPGNYFHYAALAFLEQGNQLYCKRVVNGALHAGAKIQATGGTNATLTTGQVNKTFTPVDGEDNVFYVFGKNPGAWGNAVGVRIVDINTTDNEFTIEVCEKDEDGNEVVLETFTVSRAYKKDGYGRQMYLETAINKRSAYIWVMDNKALVDTMLPEAQSTVLYLGGGSNGDPVTDSHVVAGWEKFANPDVVDIRILINGGYATPAVQLKMKQIAESRKDCIAILDVPYSVLTSATAITDWRKTDQNINSSYTCLYAGWVKMYDRYNDIQIEVPASGYSAAQMAYTDYQAGVHYAPAGMNRGRLNVLGVTNNFDQGERDNLYSAQVNPIRLFRGEGTVLWGQKTQQVKASALDRINVRRLLIVIEKAVSISLRSFCFDPNNEVTRFRITSMVEEFLALLAAKGSFQNEMGDDGYKVLCTAKNNTPAVIDRNEIAVDIFVKPSRAGEFIRLTTIVTRTGASFTELISRGAYL